MQNLILLYIKREQAESHEQVVDLNTRECTTFVTNIDKDARTYFRDASFCYMSSCMCNSLAVYHRFPLFQ